jgi:UDP-glucuronate decarboxylase
VSNFIVQALRGQDITLYGDGLQTRSFCYVDDLIEGIIRFMDFSSVDNSFYGPMNLGNTHEFTIRQLAEAIIHLTGTSSKMVFKSLPKDDPMQRKPDISRAQKYINWEAKTTLEEGLKRTIAYFETLLTQGDVEYD